MKIAIACDHAGYEYKEKLVAFLRQKGYEVKDFGTHSAESMDYPDTAHPMAAAVESGEFERGIALCGSGNGISFDDAQDIVERFLSTEFEGGRHQRRIEKIPLK